ncbi:MAG TPA: cobalt-precorrin-6A reductase [Acetobacteraceae bacterium]|nr:cobalt-precorrin-6A reductase [Acetobacteraceae bacterium]
MNLLILGGTAEAMLLGRALADDPRFAAMISLAGRTRTPAPQPLPCRIGGFGGAQGLAQFLAVKRFDALIDATHPFAEQISRHADFASRTSGIPLLSLQRPEWRPIAGDRWIAVPDMNAAAQVLGGTPRRALLTVGRKDLAPFAAAPWHRYVIRSVDPPPPELLPPNAEFIAARGPFLEEDERRLMAEREIEIVVTKNSGGNATIAKLHAARALGVKVVMIARPPAAAGDRVTTVEEALAWLTLRHEAFSPRGV